jgi:hypothetical protein
MLYENRTEFSHRLLNTVIKIGDEPIYVDRVKGTENKPVLSVFYLPDMRQPRDISCEDSTIDVSPFPLGFVNFTDGMCAYYWRNPVRNQLQGLHQGSCLSQVVWDKGHPPRYDTLISKAEFVKCVKGIYPSLKEVLKTVTSSEDDEDVPKVLAFHRKFAVARDEDCGLYVLFYKTNQVGHSVGGKTWKLGTTFSYVYEQAEEAGLNVKR